MAKTTTPLARRLTSPVYLLAAACALTAFVVVALAATPTAVPGKASPSTAQSARPTATLDRIKAADRIRIGYRDAGPMSHSAASGRPEGYSVALCNRVANALGRSIGRPALAVEWVPVPAGFTELADGRVDLICSADVITLANRAQASFSIPIFPGGVSALVRTDADAAFQDALEERPRPYAPLWRGTPPASLKGRTYSALVGSFTMEALQEHIAELRLTANVEPVTNYDRGLGEVLAGRTDVLFGDRESLLAAVRRHPSGKDLRVLSRRFTFPLHALAMRRNDDDFRLAIDRTLSGVYADPAFGALYTASFGAPDADTVAFFRNVGVQADLPIREPR